MLEFVVDCHEMIDIDLVLFSATDFKRDTSGNLVSVSTGMSVKMISEDLNDQGEIDNLVAFGTVERNTTDVSWAAHVRWCCRIDGRGVRHQSEIRD